MKSEQVCYLRQNKMALWISVQFFFNFEFVVLFDSKKMDESIV